MMMTLQMHVRGRLSIRSFEIDTFGSQFRSFDWFFE